MVGLLVVVIIIGGAFFVAIPMVANSTSTSTTESTSVTTSSTGSTSSTSGSTGTLSFKIAQPLIVAPNVNESVTVTFAAGVTGSPNGDYALSASALPKGVTASFSPSSINLPAQLGSSVTMTLSAASGATVGNATVNVQATAGTSVFTQPFKLMSVQALVLIQGGAFVPNSLTVKAGTTVYWLNLDAGGGEAGGAGGGHDVTASDGSFSSGTGNLSQYSMYSHTFATAGTVKYASAAQSFTGQIVVTS
jgi:plastocyanin